MEILNRRSQRPASYDVRLSALEVDVLFSILGRIGGGAAARKLGETVEKLTVRAMYRVLNDEADAVWRKGAVPEPIGGNIMLPNAGE